MQNAKSATDLPLPIAQSQMSKKKKKAQKQAKATKASPVAQEGAPALANEQAGGALAEISLHSCTDLAASNSEAEKVLQSETLISSHKDERVTPQASTTMTPEVRSGGVRERGGCNVINLDLPFPFNEHNAENCTTDF